MRDSSCLAFTNENRGRGRAPWVLLNFWQHVFCHNYLFFENLTALPLGYPVNGKIHVWFKCAILNVSRPFWHHASPNQRATIAPVPVSKFVAHLHHSGTLNPRFHWRKCSSQEALAAMMTSTVFVVLAVACAFITRASFDFKPELLVDDRELSDSSSTP